MKCLEILVLCNTHHVIANQTWDMVRFKSVIKIYRQMYLMNYSKSLIYICSTCSSDFPGHPSIHLFICLSWKSISNLHETTNSLQSTKNFFNSIPIIISHMWCSNWLISDLCYFVNLSVFLQTTFFLDNVSWFKVRHIFPSNWWSCPLQANYILCMGPLMCAIIVWKNSLVFHSLDKLTSFFLHAFPPIVVHLLRWIKNWKFTSWK